MLRLVRFHCRGAPLRRIRPIQCLIRPSEPYRPILLTRLFGRSAITCQISSNPRFSAPKSPRRPHLLIALTAALSIPVVSHENDKDDDVEDLTLEESMLDTSEEELRAQKYGASKDRSIFYRFFRSIKVTFLRYIYEPIATGLRFIQLVCYFIPVIVTIPIIFLGGRDPSRDDERSGTLWWYIFLVRQMERAG